MFPRACRICFIFENRFVCGGFISHAMYNMIKVGHSGFVYDAWDCGSLGLVFKGGH